MALIITIFEIMVMMGIIKKNEKSWVVLLAIMCPSIKIKKKKTLLSQEDSTWSVQYVRTNQRNTINKLFMSINLYILWNPRFFIHYLAGLWLSCLIFQVIVNFTAGGCV